MTEISYEWVSNEPYQTNKVLRLPEVDWYLSYAPAPFMGKGEETALYFIEDNGESKWYILDGDWRTEYTEAFPDLEACKKVFESHKETHLCSWSVL